MRAVLLLAVLATCGEPAADPAPPRDASPSRAPPRAHRLIEDARWDVLAAPIAFAPDGKHWVGALGYDLVTFNGGLEVSRLPGVAVFNEPLQPLAGGAWFTGSSIVAADGTVRFSGHSFGQRYGRGGSAKAMAVNAEGRIAIVNGADSPSACLCDRERGSSGSSAGELVRLTFSSEGPPRERVLIAHGGDEFEVAASRDAVAAVANRELKVWSTTGDAPPIVVPIEGGVGRLEHLTWADDRHLIGTRWVDADHDEVVVFDRDAGYRRTTSFVTAGTIAALAVRPGGAEIAIATNRYRARTVVEVDVKAIAIVDLTGKVHARIALDAVATALAWRADGKALLATLSSPVEAVVRYTVR